MSQTTTTPNYGLIKPNVNADNDLWGDHLNANADTLDALIKTVQNSAGVNSFNTRAGAVTLSNVDVVTVLPGTITPPLMDGVATIGTDTRWAHGDHVHPTDTSRYAASNPAGYVTAAGAAGAAPVQSWNTRTGTVTLSNADVVAVLPPSATAPGMDGTAAAGTGTAWARSDHIHPTDTSRYAAANPSGYQTAAQVQTAVAPALNDVGRNLLHNPLFNVAQRGAGPFTVSGYTFDRWSLAMSLDGSNVVQVVAADADRAQIGDEAANYFLNSFTGGNAGAGSYTFVYQPIENVRRLAGKQVTISFWARAASGTAKLGVSLTQHFGSGGSPSTDVALNGQSVTVATTWTRYSVTFTLPSAAGMTLGTNGDSYTSIAFWFSAGATQNVRAGNIGVQTWSPNLWGVQLEIGSVATPLEKPDPQQDLAKCQRFFLQGNFAGWGYIGAAMTVVTSIPLIVAMRATPTITPGSPAANTNLTSPTIGATNNLALAFSGTGGSSAQYSYSNSYAASADL